VKETLRNYFAVEQRHCICILLFGILGQRNVIDNEKCVFLLSVMWHYG